MKSGESSGDDVLLLSKGIKQLKLSATGSGRNNHPTLEQPIQPIQPTHLSSYGPITIAAAAAAAAAAATSTTTTTIMLLLLVLLLYHIYS